MSIDLVNMFLMTIATIRPTKQPPKLTKSQKHPPEMIKIHIQYVKLCAFITKMEQKTSKELIFKDWLGFKKSKKPPTKTMRVTRFFTHPSKQVGGHQRQAGISLASLFVLQGNGLPSAWQNLYQHQGGSEPPGLLHV